MEIQQSHLFSANATATYGTIWPPLGCYWLEGTLRYIAAKKCNGDVSKLKPIKAHANTNPYHTSGNEYVEICKNYTEDIFIVSLSKKTALHTIELDDWSALNQAPFPVANFLSQICPTNIYINHSLRRVIVFVTEYNGVWVKALTSCLFRIMPWLYPNGETLDKNEKQLFKAVHEENEDTFIKLLNDVASSIDFRTAITKITKYKTLLFSILKTLQNFPYYFNTSFCRFFTKLVKLFHCTIFCVI